MEYGDGRLEESCCRTMWRNAPVLSYQWCGKHEPEKPEELGADEIERRKAHEEQGAMG
jgi:hypothetical protein